MKTRLFAMVCAAAILAGCGGAVRLAYNNGDVALRFMAHEYFDLHGAQQEAVKTQLARFHAWHRREELPRFAAAFGAAAERLDKGLERDDAVWAIEAARARYRAIVDQGVAEFVPVAATFGPDNIDALERKLASNNEKYAKEFLSGDAAKQARARAKRLAGWLDEWLGSVTPDQEALIQGFAQAQPQLDRIRFEDRKRRQQAFVALLREHRTSPDLAARLRDYFLDWERDRSPEHRQMARDQEDRLVTLIVEVDRTLTVRQREHVVRRFEFFSEEARILARQGQPAGATARAASGTALAAQ